MSAIAIEKPYSFPIRTNCKIFLNQQFVSVLVGLIIGFFGCILVAYQGTADTESLQKVDQNLGAEYRATWNDESGSSVGVFSRDGVPIWDATQGLGYRMPNLFSQDTQSPFVFLRAILPVENIILIRLLLKSLIALALINLCVASWGGKYLVSRLVVLDISLLGQQFLFTTSNDWFGVAEYYWGLSLIVAAFCHFSLFDKSKAVVRRSWTINFSLILGLTYFFGPVGVIPLVVCIVPCLALPAVKRLFSHLKISGIFLLVAVAMFPAILNFLELASQKWPSNSSYSTQTSVFDFFQEDKIYRFQPILAFLVSAFHPILRIFDEAGSRTEFYNSVAILVMLIIRLRIHDKSSEISKLLSRCLTSCLLFFLTVLFSGVIARAKVPGLSTFFSIHAWMLFPVALALVSISFVITIGNFELQPLIKSKAARSALRTLVCVALIMGLAYPSVAYLRDFSKSENSVFRDQQVRDEARMSIQKLDLKMNQRFAALKQDGSTEGSFLFGDDSGIRFDLQLARAGYPTIDEVPYGRSVGTLVTPTEKFRSVFVATVQTCDPRVLDFLGVSTIWVEQSGDTKSANCADAIKRSFEKGDIFKPERREELGGLIVRPGSFTSFSYSQEPGLRDATVCPQFERDCLFGLAQTKFQASGGSPFQLCEDNCLFTYQWRAPAGAKHILVPSNYDKAFVVRDEFSGVELETTNFRGLLSVKIPSGYTAGVFEASINPDVLMWARIASTYLQTIVFLGCLLAMFLFGIRALKNLSPASEGRRP